MALTVIDLKQTGNTMTTHKTIKYLIVEEANEFVLYSEVDTDFAGVARNWITSGSLDRLLVIKDKLEAIKPD